MGKRESKEPQKVEASSALTEAGSHEASSSSAAVQLNQFNQFAGGSKDRHEEKGSCRRCFAVFGLLRLFPGPRTVKNDSR